MAASFGFWGGREYGLGLRVCPCRVFKTAVARWVCIERNRRAVPDIRTDSSGRSMPKVGEEE